MHTTVNKYLVEQRLIGIENKLGTDAGKVLQHATD